MILCSCNSNATSTTTIMMMMVVHRQISTHNYFDPLKRFVVCVSAQRIQIYAMKMRKGKKELNTIDEVIVAELGFAREWKWKVNTKNKQSFYAGEVHIAYNVYMHLCYMPYAVCRMPLHLNEENENSTALFGGRIEWERNESSK